MAGTGAVAWAQLRGGRQQARAIRADLYREGGLRDPRVDGFGRPLQGSVSDRRRRPRQPPPPCTCAPSQLPKQTQRCLNPLDFQRGPRAPPATATAALGPPPPGPLVSPLRFKTPVDALWRVPARWRAAPPFSLQSPLGFLEKNPCGPPDPGLGRLGAAKALSARLARGLARRPGRGRCHLGLAQGAVPKSVLPGSAAWKQTGRAALRSRPAAGRAPGRARAPPQPGSGRGRGQDPGGRGGGGARGGAARGRGSLGPRAGAQAVVITWPV